MATIPVYLTDDDGNEIEQTSGSGDFIIIGYVDQDLFANASGELYTTFYDVVQAATPEQKAEVLRGLRLAKGIRGDLRRFELSGTSENAYVKYNHSIFGGRYQSQYTALGAIAGTYLRRGGSSFTKELVESALIAGAFANFNNSFPSLVLPGDVQLSVSAGGGTVEGYAWTITDGTTTFSPTVASPTVTLTQGTWTASVVVTIDGADYDVSPQSFDVAVFSATALGFDVNNPGTGDRVVVDYQGTSNPSLLDSTDWVVERFTDWRTVPLGEAIVGSIELPALEDVDYEVVSETAERFTIRFLTGGDFRVSATARHADNSVAVALADFSVDAASDLDMSDNHYLSAATADALVSGDCHMIILGDSMMNPTSKERLRHGLLTTWQPARWAGITHGTSNNNTVFGNIDTGTTFNFPNSAPYTTVFGDNIKRDGTGGNGGRTVSAEFAQVNYLTNQGCTQFTATGTPGNFFFLQDRTKNDITTNQLGQPVLTGRMQDQGSDTFYSLAGLKTKAVFYADDAMTVTSTVSDGTVSDVTFADSSFGTFIATRTPSGAGNVEMYFGFDSSITAGEKIGFIDGFSYNPNISGLSISYMGDGGWNTANHVGGTVVDETGATALSRMTQPNEWYDDVSIQEHLKLVAYKDDALTTLRGKIVILVESQNVQPTTYDYVGQTNLDLLPLKARWEAQADLVDPSGDLKDALQFVVVSLHQANYNGDHFRHSEYLRQVIGKGGYSDIEFIDMTQEIADTYPGLDPEDFVEVGTTQNGMPVGTATDPALVWYDDGDNVHTTSAGSRAMMGAMWSVISRAATQPASVSGTVTASTTTPLTTDSVTFAISSLSADADRIVIWEDQSGTELGRGETLVTTLGVSVTRVNARVVTASGADEVLNGPALTVSAPNSPPVVTSSLALQAGAVITEGSAFNIVVTAIDLNNDTLTFSLSSTEGDIGSLTRASGVEAVIPAVAGTAGVTATYTVTITDGNGGEVVETLDVTFTSANSAPVITSAMALAGGNPAEGDSFVINVTATDVDGDDLTYIITSDGSNADQFDGPLASGVQASFTMTAGTAGVAETFSLVVTDGTLSDTATFAVTPGSANGDPVIGSFTTFGSPFEVGDAIPVNGVTITDPDGDPLTYTITYTVDGVDQGSVTSLAPFNGTVTSNVATGSHTVGVSGEHVFTLRVEDGNGGFDEATLTETIAAAPSDPFGTPDLILSGTVPATPASIDLDNIGVGPDIRLNQLNSARVQLYGDTTTRNAMGTYLSNNPDSVFVVEYSDGTINYYENSDPSPIGNKFPGAFHEIRGSAWHNEDGTSRSGPRTDLGNTIELRLYPTNEV